MKPLPTIAMGLVVVVLSARFGGYDALPDPLGWVLVLLGLRALTGLPERRTLLGVALGCLVVAALLWWPQTQVWLDGQHPSLRWALALPQLGFQAMVCHAAASLAGEQGDVSAAKWLRLGTGAVIVVAVLPVLVFAAGSTTAEAWTYVAAGFASLLVIALLFGYGARSWARVEPSRPQQR